MSYFKLVNIDLFIPQMNTPSLLKDEAFTVSVQAVEQMDLFGDMSTPPDINSPTVIV